MNHNQAVRIAIKCMEIRKRRIAVDANMHKILGANYAAAVRSSKEYDQITEAVKVLGQQRMEI